MVRQSEFDELATELEEAFGAAFETLPSDGSVPTWSEAWFDDLARRVYGVQYRGNDTYRRYSEARGVSPESLASWREIPPVPATAWKHLDLVVGGVDGIEATFRTSGTTRGAAQRGRHHVRRLSLYRASALPMFARHVTGRPTVGEPGGGPRGGRLVSLIPSPDEAPDSSLSAMIGMASDTLVSETRWIVDGSGNFEVEALRTACSGASGPIYLVGTALAFLNVIERLDGARIALPPGSRVMETGGFKGSGRDVSRAALHGSISETFAVPRGAIVNEYGMTELLSQLYAVETAGEDVLRHEAPPWLRVRALHPVTLEEMPPGEAGLLCFFDLANLGSVSQVLTEDRGIVDGQSVALLGRTEGAEPRGCSRAMDELMSGSVRS